MNFIDHLASTCGLKVRSYQTENGIVPAIIIESAGWGRLIQTLLDNHHEIMSDSKLTLRMRQYTQNLRSASYTPGTTIVYPLWFPLIDDEGESLHMEDMEDMQDS